MLGITGLIAACVLILLLLLSINLYSKWSWPVKAATVIVTSAFYVICFLSVPELLGWPTTQPLPERFRLLAIQVDQPNKLTRDEGAIYLWLTDADDESLSAPPRAYRLPYSGPLHELVVSAGAKLKTGSPQIGEFKEPEDEDIKVLKDPTRTSQISKYLQFYDMPDPLFPEK